MAARRRGPKPPRRRPGPGGPPRPGSRRPQGRRARGVVVTPAEAPPPSLDDGKMRLNRYLSSAGLCSRRTADEWIAEGKVEVNGETVKELGVRVDPAVDEVSYLGTPVRLEKPTYVLFNKPKGVLCTNANNEPRRRVMDFLTKVRGRLYTVGRLDADSEGLILVTNDGQFAQAMAHPRYGVPKTYAVLVRGKVQQEDLEKARGGVWLAEGRTQGAQIRIERTSKDRTYLKVTIREGRNREIRRVFARLGYPVIGLKRIRIGELTLHGLGSGKYRFLSKAEIADLMRVAQSEE